MTESDKTHQLETITIGGRIHASSGPVASPPGYYLCILLDKQEPWPAAFKNGKPVTVTLAFP